MEVKKHNLCLVKMAITAHLKLCHLQCIRCLLTRKQGAAFGRGRLGRDENKCSLCPRMAPSGNASCCRNIFLNHFLAFVWLVIERKPILLNITQTSQGMCQNPYITVFFIVPLAMNPHKLSHISTPHYLHWQCTQYPI